MNAPLANAPLMAPMDLEGAPEYLLDEQNGEFRVNGLAYTSRQVFELEMDRVFGRTWVYVAHESEIAQPGDFVTSYIGLRPVIVSRSDDGALNVLLNRCRHRGAALCRTLRGHAQYFNCKYHGWTYATDGRLVSVTLPQGGYSADMDKSALGLQRVPRVASYRGMIFASMADEGPTLIEHLGPARRFLDFQFDHSPAGEIELRRGTHRTEYQGNWKFQAENSTDGYHGNFVHQSFWQIMNHFGNRGGQHGNYAETDMAKILKRRESGNNHGMENGHGIYQLPLPEGGIETMFAGPDRGYMEAMAAAHGRAALADILQQYNVWIFPNVGVLLDQIRVIRPVTPDLTEVTLQFYDLKDVPETMNQTRFDGYERFFGPAAFGSPDDVEMFAINQTGLQAKEARWLQLNRGMGRERVAGDGTRFSHPTDETSQRAFYRMWARLMNDGAGAR